MSLAYLPHTHEHDAAPDPFELRAAMALTIARAVAEGQPVPEWAARDFAEIDAECATVVQLHTGAAFGL